MFQLQQWSRQRFIFLFPLFVPLRPPIDWIMHAWERPSTWLSLQIQMLITSGNNLTNISRSNVGNQKSGYLLLGWHIKFTIIRDNKCVNLKIIFTVLPQVLYSWPQSSMSGSITAWNLFSTNMEERPAF